jgi:hypothetical protein
MVCSAVMKVALTEWMRTEHKALEAVQPDFCPSDQVKVYVL